MAITSAICLSWIIGLGKGEFDHTTTTGHTFRAAGYTSSAVLSASTTAYTATAELANGAGYTTKGPQVAQSSPAADGTEIIFDFADPTFTGLTKADFRGLLFFDDTHASDASVCALDFGATLAPSGADVNVQLPAPTAGVGFIRL